MTSRPLLYRAAFRWISFVQIQLYFLGYGDWWGNHVDLHIKHIQGKTYISYILESTYKSKNFMRDKTLEYSKRLSQFKKLTDFLE